MATINQNASFSASRIDRSARGQGATIKTDRLSFMGGSAPYVNASFRSPSQTVLEKEEDVELPPLPVIQAPVQNKPQIHYIEVEKPIIVEKTIPKEIVEEVYVNVPQVREVIQPIYVEVPKESYVEVVNLLPPPCPDVPIQYRKILAEGCAKLALFMMENRHLQTKLYEAEIAREKWRTDLLKKGINPDRLVRKPKPQIPTVVPRNISPQPAMNIRTVSPQPALRQVQPKVVARPAVDSSRKLIATQEFECILVPHAEVKNYRSSIDKFKLSNATVLPNLDDPATYQRSRSPSPNPGKIPNIDQTTPLIQQQLIRIPREKKIEPSPPPPPRKPAPVPTPTPLPPKPAQQPLPPQQQYVPRPLQPTYEAMQVSRGVRPDLSPVRIESRPRPDSEARVEFDVKSGDYTEEKWNQKVKQMQQQGLGGPPAPRFIKTNEPKLLPPVVNQIRESNPSYSAYSPRTGNNAPTSFSTLAAGGGAAYGYASPIVSQYTSNYQTTSNQTNRYSQSTLVQNQLDRKEYRPNHNFNPVPLDQVSKYHPNATFSPGNSQTAPPLPVARLGNSGEGNTIPNPPIIQMSIVQETKTSQVINQRDGNNSPQNQSNFMEGDSISKSGKPFDNMDDISNRPSNIPDFEERNSGSQTPLFNSITPEQNVPINESQKQQVLSRVAEALKKSKLEEDDAQKIVDIVSRSRTHDEALNAVREGMGEMNIPESHPNANIESEVMNRISGVLKDTLQQDLIAEAKIKKLASKEANRLSNAPTEIQGGGGAYNDRRSFDDSEYDGDTSLNRPTIPRRN